MIKKYNEGINHLLVGPTREELYNNIKDLPTWKIKNISIENDLGDGLRLVFKKDPKYITSLILDDVFIRNTVISNKIEIIKVLLEYGVNPNLWKGDLLIKSVFNNNYEMTKLLLEYGADPDKCYLELVNRSKKLGFNEISELLKQYSKKDLNEGINHLLVGPTDEEIFKHLKEKYITPDKILIHSMKIKSYLGIKYALESGSNIKIIRDDIYEVVTDKYIDILELLIKYNLDIHEQEDLMLVSAAERTQEKVLKLLIKYGCDVNAHNGRSLIFACNYGYYDIVKILVDNGANIHVKDERPLKNAASVAYYKIMKLLLEHGADVEKIPESSITRMIECKRHDCLDLINEYKNKNRKRGLTKIDEGINHLLVGPTDEEIIDGFKNNPNGLLSYSIRTEFIKGIEVSLENGANINKLLSSKIYKLCDIMNYSDQKILHIFKHDKWDAMTYAISRRRKGIIKVLFHNGFEFNEIDKQNLFFNDPELFEYINNNIKPLYVSVKMIKSLIEDDRLEDIKKLIKMGCYDIYWFAPTTLQYAIDLNKKDIIDYFHSINVKLEK